MRYEGLNLPQLMELMHGLALPAPVSWMPATPGWWVLLGWLTAVCLIAVRQWLLWRRRNRYRRDAEAELATIAAQAEANPAAAAAKIAALVKRTALVAYERTSVASLYGADWARFIRASVNDDPLVAAAADELASAAYRSDADGRKLVAAARRWIRFHRA
jgi:hypothetical protein